MKRIVFIMSLVMISMLSITSTAFAASSISDSTGSSSAGGDYILDQNNTLYVYQDGEFKEVEQTDGTVSVKSSGFGESNARWITTKTPNGYTVKHKGWKERKSTSVYGVRACSKTTCSPTKNHYTRARMTSSGGAITYTDSGQKWSTGTARAKSPYQNCHYNNSVMRSNWGGVY